MRRQLLLLLCPLLFFMLCVVRNDLSCGISGPYLLRPTLLGCMLAVWMCGRAAAAAIIPSCGPQSMT